MSSSPPRIKIRCPQCRNDGSARAEFLNHRVSCKHCSHVFRVVPIDEASANGVGTATVAASPPLPDTESSTSSLQAKLDKALKSARKAEAGQASLREELEKLRERLDLTIVSTGDELKANRLDEELHFLRTQLDKARAEAESETRKRLETDATLGAQSAGHVEALLGVKQELEMSRLEAQARLEAEQRATAEARALRDELEAVRGRLDEANSAIEAQKVVETRNSEAFQVERAGLEARLVEAEATRTHRDQLAQELETHQGRLAEAERLALGDRSELETLRLDRDRIASERLNEVGELRDQLTRTLAGSADAAILRQELDEARTDRDRMARELEALHAKIAEATRREADWSYPSTELDIPLLPDPDEVAIPAEAEAETQAQAELAGFDEGAEKFRLEAESLKVELVELADRLVEKESEFGDLTERARAEALALRRELYEARLEIENATKMNRGLADRVRELEATEEPETSEPPAPAIDPALIEAERKKAVDEAVKLAWADFERRLTETQARLQAANARADLMEAEARDAREEMAARARSIDQVGDGSAFGGEISAATSLRILEARGNPRMTPADAEARLALARQLAVERKEKALIDRISKMTEKVKGDLEARNYTLAETLVRGAEIETGLDPGGFSINGLRIFRASPTIVGSLTALAPSFDRVMRDGAIDVIRTTIDEMKTILGDQAGLPEIRLPGRTPSTLRPIEPADAFRLFMDALIAESWLIRPIVQKRPLPETSLGTYAALIEASCLARKFAQGIDPEKASLLDEIIQGACLMLTRRQQADGHFAFLDPRGRTSKASSVVAGMIAQRPDAVKDGWVVHVDPIGLAQVETGVCGVALATAGKALGRENWTLGSQRAAEWAAGQPCLPHFVANAASVGLVARSYLDTQTDSLLVSLLRKLDIGLLPGQFANGRWVDPTSATTPNHLLILRALHDAWEAIPEERLEFRKDLKASLDRAMSSLLEESKALGVASPGLALRDLIRHRDLFTANPETDPRLETAILEAATVIQDLCHDGPKPKLGVAADQLAALMLL